MQVHVTIPGGECTRTFALKGRLGWTIVQLVEAGSEGITSMGCPALRVAAYIHSLRKKGVEIETIMETHGGAYGGQHARYRLACDVTVVRQAMRVV